MADQASVDGFDSKPLEGFESKPLDGSESKPSAPVKSRRDLALDREKKAKQNQPVRDAAIGALKGAGRTAVGLGRMVHKIPGVDAMLGKIPDDAETTLGLDPKNTAEKVGQAGERVAEFFAPSGAAKGMGLAAKVATEGVGALGVATAQGDEHPIRAAVLSAVLAPFGALEKAAPGVKASAEGSMRKVLMQGTELADKARQKVVNESVNRALDLGLSAKWRSVLAKAGAVKQEAGTAVQSTLAGGEGSTPVTTKPIVDALEAIKSKAQNLVPVGKSGKAMGAVATGNNPKAAVTFNQQFLTKIEKLQKILENHGPTMEARQLHNIKEDWNAFVYKGKSVMDTSGKKLALESRAKKAATDAMIQVFKSEAPAIADVDREYHLARQTYDVIADAAGLGRLTPAAQALKTQTARNVNRMVTGAGAALGGGAGLALGHSPVAAGIGAAVGTATAHMLDMALKSPGWKLLPAASKNALASALAAGKAETVRRIVAPLVAGGAAGKTVPGKPDAAKPSTGPVKDDQMSDDVSGVFKMPVTTKAGQWLTGR